MCKNVNPIANEPTNTIGIWEPLNQRNVIRNCHICTFSRESVGIKFVRIGQASE